MYKTLLSLLSIGMLLTACSNTGIEDISHTVDEQTKQIEAIEEVNQEHIQDNYTEVITDVKKEELIQTTEILDAVAANNIEKVKQLVQQTINIDIQNDKGETALLIATHLNYVELAKLLIEHGANVNIQDKKQDSPFLYASAEGRTEILKFMLAYDIDTAILNRFGGTGLIPAAEKGHLENVQLLLADGRTAIDHMNNSGWTALLEAIVLSDGDQVQQAIVKELLVYGADPNKADARGVTPLQHAKKKGYINIVRLLEAAGAK
ncbi:ankyrin repeat domain-containing protein [Lysinibacillus piscis]|uniref:Ankyrin repeat domain-containing protein n=1 Tax=Lysinibacillus piscis TaxID=2518931 RepID=A0ABQ5NH41_9BACI|nr:ankyrin repeat domain-containing protein [Lysinibacillus sp. KH24]GLC87688.1 hypothetical protein LYSBPC_08150 [Lysinibacillus sp. KH24]